jgi:hypothetical protein
VADRHGTSELETAHCHFLKWRLRFPLQHLLQMVQRRMGNRTRCTGMASRNNAIEPEFVAR